MAVNDREADRGRQRRALLRACTIGVGALAVARFGPRGAAASATAAAAAPSDVETLQTAASLENLAVATYNTILGLPFMTSVPPLLRTFAIRTKEQHTDHARAFNAAVTRLGGRPQEAPNPVLAETVEMAKPTLRAPADVVKLALDLEEAASATYLANTITLRDIEAKRAVAGVSGVEAQHVAVLHAARALIEAGNSEFLAAPPPAYRLPSDFGKIGFPAGFLRTEKARPPDEGALR